MSDGSQFPLLVCAAIAAALGYGLGYRHGAGRLISPSRHLMGGAATRGVPEIPAYRVQELAVLMELGVLTPEEFEHEKGKLYAFASI